MDSQCGYNDHIGDSMTKKTAVGSRALKTHLGAYLRQVQNGRILIITDRGRPVAELKPIVLAGDCEKGRLDELIALGLLTRKSDAPLLRVKPIPGKGVSLSAAIIEDREDRL
jgi:prevent-host-death family protein